MKRLVLLFLTVLTLTSCGNKNVSYEDASNRQYNQYYEQFGLKDIQNEFYGKEESNYAVYMYGTTCSYCDKCKGAVLDYLDDLREGKDKKLDNLYIFEREKEPYFRDLFKSKPKDFLYERDRDIFIQKMIGASAITETYFFGTPSLYVIKDHKLSDVIVGDKLVGSYLVKN